jgi:hypothetical protein
MQVETDHLTLPQIWVQVAVVLAQLVETQLVAGQITQAMVVMV